MTSKKITLTEKIGYGLGDTASNLVFQTVMLFLAFFYTDIFGISAATVGTMFLVVRIFDGVTDPILGWMADKTQTKWGKFRPYLLWMSLPLVITCWLTFSTPDLSDTHKVIYAYVTYALLMLAYTAINIPYCALGGVITSVPQERVSLQSYRFALAMLGGLAVSAFTLPMVDWFGGGDKKLGYQSTMLIMSLFGALMFAFCFFTTRERVHPPKGQKLHLKDSLRALISNDQWRILSFICFIVLVAMVIRNTVTLYYVTYYLHQENQATLFITLGMLGAIAGSFLSQYCSYFFCKIKSYSAANALAGLVCVVSLLIPSNNYVLAAAAHILVSFCLQIATPLLWTMMADVVDYGQHKSGSRITGLTYSSNLFFLKLGMAFGGAIAGWMLAYYGYEAGQEQTATTLEGILFLFTILPGILFCVSSLVILKYKLNNSMMENIQNKLALQNNH